MGRFYDEFRKKLPDTEETFPPYLFALIDLLKTADEEAESSVASTEELNAKISELEAKLLSAQEENLRLMSAQDSNEEEEEEKKEEEVKDEIKDIDDLLEGGLDLDY